MLADKVYVAIPVFNGARTLSKTLKSVLDQTFSEFEVLVYDDGSTDRTAEVVSKFATRDSRVRLVSGGQNLGRSAARNALVKLCGNSLIAWQDADDTWKPEKLEQQLQFLESLRDSGADLDKVLIMSTYLRWRQDKGKPKPNIEKMTPPEVYDAAFVFSPAYSTCPFQLQATLGRASVYERAGGFDDNLRWSEDIDLALRVLQSGQRIVGHRAQSGLALYHHTLSRARGTVVEESQEIIKNRYRDFAKGHGIDIDEVFASRESRYLLNVYLQGGNYAAVAQKILEQIQRGERQQLVAKNLVSMVRQIAREEARSALRGVAQSEIAESV